MEGLNTLIKVFIKEAEIVSLKTNDTKTTRKYMHFTRNYNHREGPLKIDEHEFNQVEEFKYLGISIPNQNTDELDI